MHLDHIALWTLRLEELRADGHPVVGEPRTSGDGYFESVVADPDGNRIEIVYKP